MHHDHMRVQIQQSEDSVLELRYFETSSAGCYLGWKMLAEEADDLARWWASQGKHIGLHNLPIRHLRTGCILVSMATRETLEVRGVDKYGRTNLKGYSLPREVVELLAKEIVPGQPSKAHFGPKVNELC